MAHLHIVGGTLALFMGPFQLWSGLRERHFEIHRWTGRLYVLGIFIAGLGGFGLSRFEQPREFGFALFVLSSVWWVTVAIGFLAIRRGNITEHREWMIRGYVVTFAFVTFRMLVDFHVGAVFGDNQYALRVWLSWSIPLLITEACLSIPRLSQTS